MANDDNRQRGAIDPHAGVSDEHAAYRGRRWHGRGDGRLPAPGARYRRCHPPPGVADEKFQSRIRCGCVRDCPYDTLKLAELGDEVAMGTPYFEARYSVRDVRRHPRVKACLTGALDLSLTDIEKLCMGLAVVVDQEACIAFRPALRGLFQRLSGARQGDHAGLSAQQPQWQTRAVHPGRIRRLHRLRQGEKACILEEAAIAARPNSPGHDRQTYRLGWGEDQAGEALVARPAASIQPAEGDNEHGGEGLIIGEFPPRRPAAAAGEARRAGVTVLEYPLDTLNRKGGLDAGR